MYGTLSWNGNCGADKGPAELRTVCRVMVKELTSALTAGKKRCPNRCKWAILILSMRLTMSNWVWTGKLRSYVGEGGKQGKDCSKQTVAYEPNSAMNLHRTHHRAGWVGRHSQEGNTAHTGTLSLVLPQLRVWMSSLPSSKHTGCPGLVLTLR